MLSTGVEGRVAENFTEEMSLLDCLTELTLRYILNCDEALGSSLKMDTMDPSGRCGWVNSKKSVKRIPTSSFPLFFYKRHTHKLPQSPQHSRAELSRAVTLTETCTVISALQHRQSSFSCQLQLQYQRQNLLNLHVLFHLCQQSCVVTGCHVELR